MSGTMVHVMLHGLIALVPMQDTNHQWNHMMALVVNAKDQRPDLQCFVPHQAVLTVVAENDDCVMAGCSATNEDNCTCEIGEFQDIRLEPDVQTVGQVLGSQPAAGLPSTPAQATNFAYVGNLENLGRRIKRGLLDLNSIPADPNPLIARMYFPFESANACSLATRHNFFEGETVHPLNFRPLGEVEKSNEVSQAMAQAFMAHYMLPDGPGNSALTLKLGKPGDLSPRSIVLKPGADGYLIILENRRTFALLPDDPCDDGVARDFSLLYDLVEGNAERLIPHVKYTRWERAKDLESPDCLIMKDPGSRPVCPIGAFYPAAGSAQ